MEYKDTIEKLFTKQSDGIQQVIKRTCIVDFGLVIKVLGENVVKVGISVADSIEDVQILTCTLLSPCSSSMAVNIVPKVGDKVLVLSPRHYNPDMFKLSEDKPIIDDLCRGYTRLSAVAILFNQYNENDYKNLVNIDDGAVTLSNDKYEAKINADGYLSYKNKTDNKTTLEFTSTGSTMQDANGCKIVTDSNGTTINGNLTIKKSGV